MSIPEPVAARIHDILVEHAGMIGAGFHRQYRDFVHALATDCREYRFGGSLGFGGKYWPEEWRVSCYSEDETKERRETITRTNEALAKLRAELENEAS